MEKIAVLGGGLLGGSLALRLRGRLDCSLWARREATVELIPAAAQRDLAIVVGSPLQQGALAARYDTEIEAAWWLAARRREQFEHLYRLLDETRLSITDLSHRFSLSDSRVSCVLSGARSASEVASVVAAAEAGPLDDDLRQRLDEIAAMVPYRPCDEPTMLPFGRDWDGPSKLR